MTDRERTYGRIAIYTALLAAAVSVGTLVWNLSSTTAMVRTAYAYVEQNQSLPTKIAYHADQLKSIDDRLCALERLTTNVAVLNSNITTLTTQLQRIESDVRSGRNNRQSESRTPHE